MTSHIPAVHIPATYYNASHGRRCAALRYALSREWRARAGPSSFRVALALAGAPRCPPPPPLLSLILALLLLFFSLSLSLWALSLGTTFVLPLYIRYTIHPSARAPASRRSYEYKYKRAYTIRSFVLITLLRILSLRTLKRLYTYSPLVTFSFNYYFFFFNIFLTFFCYYISKNFCD